MLDAWQIKSLKDAVDCRAIVSSDLGPALESKGASHIFRCPFHNERTPGGFHVFKDGYKCFSCGKSGDVLTWLIQYRKLAFVDAVAVLNGGQALDVKPIDPVEAARRAAEQAERAARDLQRKIEEAQKALRELQQAQIWLRYYDSLTPETRRLWHARGLPDWWIDFWQLGYSPAFDLWQRDETGEWVSWWTSPTLSIPVWGLGWEAHNVKHRLLNEPPKGGKYHPERRLPAAPFVCNPDLTHSKPLLICEGEIKSMVAFAALDDPNLQVIGLPGATPDAGVLKGFEDFEPVYLLMDPDAYEPCKDQPAAIERVLNSVGRERARVVRLPDKVDDMIVAGSLNRFDLKQTLRTAERCR